MTALSKIPVYVTRPKGDGSIGFFALSRPNALAIMLVIEANVLGWGTYGLVTLGSKAVSLLG